ncbi:MAG: DUF5076 domain-containing protein [Leptolyngbya sp.]|nr:DUF5076 domain-containing protein [Candidatus Melainabacteria bacterium]
MIELPLPYGISSSETARELLRIWSSGEETLVNIDGALNTPAMCGRLIVDVAICIARDYIATGTYDGTVEDALYRILSAVDAELSMPSEEELQEQLAEMMKDQNLSESKSEN